MNLATMAGGVVALFIVAAAVIYLFLPGGSRATVARVLRWLALAATLGITIAVMPTAVADKSEILPYLFGVPMLVCIPTVIADSVGKSGAIVTAVSALVMGAWGVFPLGMFFAPYFLIPALILGVAALASIRPRSPAPHLP